MDTTRDRFEKHVNKITNGCWEWTACITAKGYGEMGAFGKVQKAHRVSWMIHVGKIPKGMCVRQRCGNRKCCNPSHLYLNQNVNDSETWENSFFSNITKISCGCWYWIGATNSSGYGVFRNKWSEINGRGRMEGAHRISYRIHKGPIPVGKHVLHKCDNPPCCNPDHLFVGTPMDNIHDCIRKGRKRFRVGSEVKNSKITESIVREARSLFIPYKRGQSARSLAKRFGISESNMLSIVRGRAWKHVK